VADSDLMADLEARVRVAIKNALTTSYDHRQKTTEDSSSHAKTVNTYFKDVDYHDCGEFHSDKPHQVTVENPFEYWHLLRISFEILATEYYFEDLNLIGPAIGKAYFHEIEHARPTLDNPEINLRYGITFYKDKESNRILYMPMLSVYGKLPRELHERIASAPKNLSHDDKMLISN
jgi:hypothetical protein